MSLIVPKEIAVAVGNLVRGTALSQFPSWRPIAYGFDSSASVLTVEDVKESPVDINIAFGSLTYDYEPAEVGDVISEVYHVSGVFDSSALKEVSKFRVGGNSKLLTSLKPMSLRVFYLYALGKREEMENKALLEASGNLVVFSSRHTKLDNISFQISPRVEGNVALEFACNDAKAITSACRYLSEILASVK
jgi:hypothetical protein